MFTGSLNQAGLKPGQTETTQDVVSVGVAAQQIALNNPTRVNGIFINISGASIFLSPNAFVSLNKGIELIPGGGFFSVSQWSDYDFACFPFYAIATMANSPLLFIETTYNGT